MSTDRPAELQGLWPANDLRRVFVEGAKWWQFHANGATAFPSEIDEMEAEATRRFESGDPGVAVACEHQFVTHMIRMPEGYQKPGITRCEKCGMDYAPGVAVAHKEQP